MKMISGLFDLLARGSSGILWLELGIIRDPMSRPLDYSEQFSQFSTELDDFHSQKYPNFDKSFADVGQLSSWEERKSKAAYFLSKTQ
jgi:hypothetical protein